MICNSFPSVTTTATSLNNNNNNKPSNVLLNFNHSYHIKTQKLHVSTRPRNIRYITVRASAATAADNTITAPEKETLYDLLGISETGTLSEIKNAYKKMALKYHPDVSPPDRMEEYTVKFIRVQEAYETLSDPEARSVYDRCMAKGLHFAFKGKRDNRVDPRSEDKKGWKEMWSGQISELVRRSGSVRRGNKAGGMSWAARIRKQRSESCGYGSDSG